MKGIIIVTHSNMANGTKEAAEMIVGEQENFYALGFYVGEGLEDLHSKIQKIIDENNCDEWIIFTDMFGATPANVSSIIATENKATVITGFNLGMILECVALRDSVETKELVSQLTDTDNLGIRYIDKDIILNNN